MTQTGATIDNSGFWWVPMPSGIKFYPENPNPEHVNILDVAQKLAQQCRYGGGTTRFYSVAEHCVHLSHVTPTAEELEAYADEFGLHSSWGALNHFQREALMHDRAEWALQDFIRPLKNKCAEWYYPMEQNLERVTAIKFGLRPRPPKLVMDYDFRICIDEKRQGIACEYEASNAFEATAPVGVTLEFWSPEVARMKFLDRFFYLFPDANEKGWVA